MYFGFSTLQRAHSGLRFHTSRVSFLQEEEVTFFMRFSSLLSS